MDAASSTAAAPFSPDRRSESPFRPAAHGGLAALTIGAIGIVYGDIGTSPLYALNQLFFGPARLPIRRETVLGGISLVIWTITIIVALKYAALVLRAENDGEGGVFALYGLLHEHKRRGMRLLLWALMLGAGLLFGDGFITPAISVLSAVEGLQVAAPGMAGIVVPLTVLLLTALFAVQFKGTAGIGSVFGPVLLVWFLAIGIFGAVAVARTPEILFAFNPLYGLRLLVAAGGTQALFTLAALMLVVTGGEAMYADLGHFGAQPIRIGWFGLVYPALLFNYLGQGAWLLDGRPVAQGNLFFSLVPAVLLYPMVVLATAATIIASQALISGAFTLAAQAVRLGLFPRLTIRHTHTTHSGQIYIAFVNWGLFVGCILLVLIFGSSSNLAAAYGLAVAGVMVITSFAMMPVARLHWGWRMSLVILVWGSLAAVNSAFLLAGTLKFMQGGFVPLALGASIFLVMITWQWGRKATYAAYTRKSTMTVAEIVRIHRTADTLMERNVIVMAAKPVRSPEDHAPALIHLVWERHGLLPRNLIFVEVTHRKVPYIHDGRYRVTLFDRDPGRGSVIGVELQFGFMEEPNVERALEELARHHEVDLPPDRHRWCAYVALEHLLPSRRMTVLERLMFRLFTFLRNVSEPAYYYYGLGDELNLTAEILPVRVR